MVPISIVFRHSGATRLFKVEFLADDDKLNQMDIPTEEKDFTDSISEVSVDVPGHQDQQTSHMYQDDDSVSTFQTTNQTLSMVSGTSRVSQPQFPMSDIHGFAAQNPQMPPSVAQDRDGLVSKFSDTKSRMADLETNMAKLAEDFKLAMHQMKKQSSRQAREPTSTQETLHTILDILKGNSPSPATGITHPSVSEAANHPQINLASDLSQVAGHGS
jgi:hypothetical protein